MARMPRLSVGLLDGQGYVGDKLFNSIHGAQRLNYSAPDGRWTIDVVIDGCDVPHVDLRDGCDRAVRRSTWPTCC